MKTGPTLEGGLRIDAEDEEDWELIRGIIADTNEPGRDLASRLGSLITPEAGAEDWQEFIVPDLREAFQDDVAQIGASIDAAIFEAAGDAGSIWIKPNEAAAWYSVLNQARLALEERFRFGPDKDFHPMTLEPEKRSAYIRSKFYSAIQGLLLEYVMT